MTLDKEEIKNLLPHREPFLFVDAVSAFAPKKSITASLELKADLPFFRGHFPNNPIMPGVLVVESLAQTSGLFLALSARDESVENNSFKAGSIFYLASNNIKFVGVAKAGDVLELTSSLTREFAGLYHFSVSATSGRRKIAEGTLVLASPNNVAK